MAKKLLQHFETHTAFATPRPWYDEDNEPCSLLRELCSLEVLVEAGERSAVAEGPTPPAIKEELLFGIPSAEPALQAKSASSEK